jgi:hypothetical protein
MTTLIGTPRIRWVQGPLDLAQSLTRGLAVLQNPRLGQVGASVEALGIGPLPGRHQPPAQQGDGPIPAAAVLCPIAIGTAARLDASADPFLVAVAIGASCAFLTPIGHQNNTLILGPGGFRFGDYWPLGLPLEILVLAVAVPLLLLVWPL